MEFGLRGKERERRGAVDQGLSRKITFDGIHNRRPATPIATHVYRSKPKPAAFLPHYLQRSSTIVCLPLQSQLTGLQPYSTSGKKTCHEVSL